MFNHNNKLLFGGEGRFDISDSIQDGLIINDPLSLEEFHFKCNENGELLLFKSSDNVPQNDEIIFKASLNNFTVFKDLVINNDVDFITDTANEFLIKSNNSYVNLNLDASSATGENKVIFKIDGVDNWLTGIDNLPAISANNYSIKTSNNSDPLFTIKTDGNTGFGVNDPQYKLDVDGSINSSGMIVSGNINNTILTQNEPLFKSTNSFVNMILDASSTVGENYINYKIDGANKWIVGIDNLPAISADNYSIKTTGNTDPIFTIKTNGNTGIGVNDPQYILDTGGDINTTGDYRISGNSVLSNTTLGSGIVNSSLTSLGTLTSLTTDGNITLNGARSIVFNTTSTNQTSQLTLEGSFGGTTNAWKLLVGRGGGAASNDLRFSYDSTEYITIRPDGKIGINKTSPTAQLEVETVGNDIVGSFRRNETASNAYINIHNNTSAPRLTIGYSPDGIEDGVLASQIKVFNDLEFSTRTNANAAMRFSTCGNGTTGDERMVINANGDIDINNALTVLGTSYLNEIIGPDNANFVIKSRGNNNNEGLVLTNENAGSETAKIVINEQDYITMSVNGIEKLRLDPTQMEIGEDIKMVSDCNILDGPDDALIRVRCNSNGSGDSILLTNRETGANNIQSEIEISYDKEIIFNTDQVERMKVENTEINGTVPILGTTPYYFISVASTVSISNNTETVIDFDTAKEVNTPSGYFSFTNGTERINFLKAGYFQGTVIFTWDDNSDGVRKVEVEQFESGGLLKTRPAIDTKFAHGNIDNRTTVSFIINADINEYIRVRAYQNSGGARDLAAEISLIMIGVK